jgi:hypothetical protein
MSRVIVVLDSRRETHIGSRLGFLGKKQMHRVMKESKEDSRRDFIYACRAAG